MKDQITLDQALDLIVQRTGKTRRQAKVELVEMMRSGKLKATGINPYTEQRETIPPNVWPAVN